MSVVRFAIDSSVTEWHRHHRLAAAWAEGDRWGMEQHGAELGPFALWLVERMPAHATVLEIGTRRGGTLAFWHTLLDGYSFGIDNAEDRAFSMQRKRELEDAYPELCVALRDSHSRASKEWAMRHAPVDFLFLDGDHSPEGIAQDYADYAPLVRPGGIIAFHDVVDSPQNRALGIGVPDFWKNLEGEKYEWICGAPWGGLGALVKA